MVNCHLKFRSCLASKKKNVQLVFEYPEREGRDCDQSNKMDNTRIKFLNRQEKCNRNKKIRLTELSILNQCLMSKITYWLRLKLLLQFCSVYRPTWSQSVCVSSCAGL